MARILVVDDEQVVRNIYKMVLEAEGHKVALASDGNGAMYLLGNNSFDLVITDLNMPIMKGDELSLKIKEKNPSLPVIMITSDIPVQYACDAVLPKPISIEDLRKVVASHLKK